jgi:hypothetical protein
VKSKLFRAYIHDTARLHYIFVARDGETWYVKAYQRQSQLFGEQIEVPLMNGIADFLEIGFRRQSKTPDASWEIVRSVWAHNDPEAGRGAKILAELKAGWDDLMGRLDPGGYRQVDSLGSQRRREIHRS